MPQMSLPSQQAPQDAAPAPTAAAPAHAIAATPPEPPAAPISATREAAPRAAEAAAPTPTPLSPGSPSAAADAPTQVPGWMGRVLPQGDRATRVLGIAAIVLFVTRFIPTHTMFGRTLWTWSGDGEAIFTGMVFPILTALVYAFVAFGPAHLKQSLPAGAMRVLPFLFAFLGVAILHAATPFGAMVKGGGLVSWGYPILALGLLGLSQSVSCGMSRVLIGVGGLLTFIGAMIGVKHIFAFAGQPALFILHNVLFFVVVLIAFASTALAIPKSLWPQVDAMARYAPHAAGVLLAWPALAWFLFSMAAQGVSKLTVLLHCAAALFGFFFVMWMYAPHVLGGLRRITAKMSAPPASAQ
jgi:hypothetical protein